jgi:hypothetical protein
MIRNLTTWAFAIALSLSAAQFAAAQDVTDADKRAFRDIISAQIEAFRADDGARAFSFASPSIKSIFSTPESFMSMVRNGYAPVYRPQSVKFGTVTRELGPPTQKVHLIGPSGGAWTALYAMQKLDDGSWKISAVALVKEDGAGA